MDLNENQKTAILTRSKQAQAFLASSLFKDLETWISQEQALTAASMATNTRAKSEESLTRAEFLERKSAYWLVLPTMISVFKGWAEQEKQLQEFEDAKRKEH